MIDSSSESPQNITYLQQLPAILTCTASGLVILTFLLFKDLRRLRYVELVFYISVSDFIGGLALAIGPTNDGSAACYFQGITSNITLLSSTFWTVIINYQVWLIVNRGSVLKDLTYYHCLCWGLPTLLTLLPISTSTFGNQDDDLGWCFYTSRSYSPSWVHVLWVIVSLYFWTFLNLAISCVLITTVIYRLKGMQIIPEIMKTTVQKLILYPVVIFCCWFIATLNLFLKYSGSEYHTGLGNCALILQGFFFAVIFFSLNPLVRLKWAKLVIVVIDHCFLLCGLGNIENRIFSTISFTDIKFEDELDYIPIDSTEEERQTMSRFTRLFSSTAERKSASIFEWNFGLQSNTNNIRSVSTLGKDLSLLENKIVKDVEISAITSNPINNNTSK